jgi:hypothetical protein
MRKAECGVRKEKKRRQKMGIRKEKKTEALDFRFGILPISDFGFGIETAREGNRRYLQWLIEVIRFTG